jgi:adenylate cyclase
MSGDPEQEYFADGIAEDLITALCRVSWFFVIARNSSFAFRGGNHDVRLIGQKLGVRYLVEGSVRRAGSRVRVTAQLIEAASGNHLWADKYDGPLDQIFELQDTITENLIGAIEPKLRAAEIARARRKRPERLDAFDLLLQALPNHWMMSQQGFNQAITLLDQAIALAPTYAEALGYAAACRAFRPLHNCSPDPAKDFREADELARRALEADPVDPVALRSASFVSVLARRDFESAFDLIGRSLAIDPNGALTWGYRGWINIWAGNQDDAISDCDKALRLSPLDQWISTYSLGRSFALSMSGRLEEGLRWARRAMQENPHWTASYRGLVAALVLNGKLEEARPVAANLLKIDPGFSVYRWAETAPFRRTEGQEGFFAALCKAGLPA